MPTNEPKPIYTSADADHLAWLSPPNDGDHPPSYHHFEFPERRFEHAARGFRLVNACWLADASLLAYGDADVARQRFRDDAGMTSRPLFRGTTQCYVAEDADKVIVAFRGTQVLKPGANGVRDLAIDEVFHDWLTDGHALVVPVGGGGTVHDGFHAALEALWGDASEEEPGLERILDALAKADADAGRPARTVWFTGHSLGGAIATLAAHAYRHPERARLYTFGSPRVGDRAFCESLRVAQAYRLVHESDIVATVPHVAVARERRFAPDEWHAYSHVGRRLDVREGVVVPHAGGEHDEVRPSRLFGVLGGALRQIVAEWLSALPTKRFADHAPTFYASLLWNAYLAQGEGAVRPPLEEAGA